jgi:hypothetical protein
MWRNGSRTLTVATFLAALALGDCLLGAEGQRMKRGADRPAAAPAAQERTSPAAAIRQALAKPIAVDYNKLPLKEVAKDLEAKLGVPVRLDSRTLVDLGVEADTPITFASIGVSARSTISLMLREMGLTALTKYDVLLLTTPDEAANMDETRAYEVSDVVCGGGQWESNEIDFDSLTDLIRCSIQPSTWDGNGCIGSYAARGINAIVFAQMEDVHEEVDLLLWDLRAARESRAKKSREPREEKARTTPAKPKLRPISAEPSLLGVRKAETAIRQAMMKPVDLRYDERPLGKVAEDLEAKLGVPVRLDGMPLRDIGVSPETPVTFASSRVSAKAAIALMLRAFGMAAVVKYEVLLFTAPHGANYAVETRVYEVSDLVFTSASAPPCFQELTDLVQAEVSPFSWERGTRPGSIHPFEGNDFAALVISQTEAGHEEVESLLAQLRAVRDPRVSDRDIAKLIRKRNKPQPVPAQPPANAPGQGGMSGMGMF